MRLDKFLTQSAELTRSVAKKVLHAGEVTVNGSVIKDSKYQVDPAVDDVEWAGEALEVALGHRYILLYKPDGYECTLKPKHYPMVTELIAIPQVNKLRIAGRLDVDTTGLLLLSDDGVWLHRVTSPKHACEKIYDVTLATAMNETAQADAIEQFQQGVMLDSETSKTKPAGLSFMDETHAQLALTEGKYHQVKRMFASIGNHVTDLHRSRVGILTLEGLAMGECRELSPDEVKIFL